MNRLAAAKTSRRARLALELFLRFDGLERHPAVGQAHEALRALPELPRVPAAVRRVPENEGNDFDAFVHGALRVSMHTRLTASSKQRPCHAGCRRQNSHLAAYRVTRVTAR